ncbi:MAG: 50S ribosomal protein L18, partial [Methanomassiliicoccaceae archaeon]|nr:50S ribosomal protein L18 [Methanomassiliicoccaceae archaeon]
MATGPRYKVPFRRRRENRTDYYIRKKLLSSGEMRAVVRRSSKNVNIQFAKFGMEGDSIAVSTTSMELKALGWEHSCSNIPAAYLTGYLAGKKAVKAGIEYAVLDIGMQTPSKGAVLFAAAAGMIDAGVEIPHGDVLPSEERLNGAHISDIIAGSAEAVKAAIDGKPKAVAAKAKKAEAPAEEKKPAKAKKAEPAAEKTVKAKPAEVAEKKPAKAK